MQLNQLNEIKEPLPLNELTEIQLKELQAALNLLGYPVGDVDGLIGPKTRTAWAEFKSDVFQGNPVLIGTGSIQRLQELLNEIVDKSKHDFSTVQGTIAAITAECKAQGLTQKEQIAYVLATVEWETAKEFKPVREAFWLSEEWRKQNLRYYPYYGRGYVQLTWRNNYQKYSDILRIDLVNDPDLALKKEIALFVLVHGFKTGTFTGRKISDYINSHHVDFDGARYCINGNDHARDTSKLAQKYLDNDWRISLLLFKKT